MKFVTIVIMTVSIQACQTPLNTLSRRSIANANRSIPSQFVRKDSNPLQNNGNDQAEIFMKRDNIKIRESAPIDDGGSLFRVDNPNNFLFYEKPNRDVGDIVTVFVRTAASKEEPAQPVQGDNANQGEVNADQLEKELLEALPNFAPSSEKAKPITKLRFKVLKKLPNGDVLVETYRTSKNKYESNQIRAKARISSEKIETNDLITTADLQDVEFFQFENSQTTERESIGWEDEYTLRFSGFNEAKSKAALELERKRKELMELRDRLQQRIGNVSKERSKVAADRMKINELKANTSTQINNLNEKIKDLEKTINEQKEIIKKQEEVINGPKEDSGSGLFGL